MKKYSKAYRSKVEKIEKDKIYSLDEACKLAVETSPVKFDASVEIHVNTGTDPRHADQIVRSTVVLPNGTGKSVRIAVFCDDAKAAEAKKAGADKIGAEDLIESVLKGELDFDIAIAQPSMMKDLAKVARVLGPKGLMPSPKSGTVTDDIAKAIEEIKKGKLEYRNDKAGIVHTILGKVSFGQAKITENAKAFIVSLIEAKPQGTKGTYVKKITMTTSMGPSIQVDVQDALNS
jgi:large subunit ribosomal protein L1